MPDHPDPYTITTAPERPNAFAPPTGLHYPPMLPHEIPPGIQPVLLPDGTRTLAYTQPPPQLPAPAPAVARPVPVWAKTTALLAPTIGGGIAAAGIGLSYAAPGLIAMSQALWAAVALIAIGGAAGVTLIRAARARAAERTQITQHITATGLFGRAQGTINHH